MVWHPLAALRAVLLVAALWAVLLFGRSVGCAPGSSIYRMYFDASFQGILELSCVSVPKLSQGPEWNKCS